MAVLFESKVEQLQTGKDKNLNSFDFSCFVSCISFEIELIHLADDKSCNPGIHSGD